MNGIEKAANSLKKIDIYACKNLAKVDGVEKCVHLTCLEIYECKIATFPDLNKTQLTYLDFSNNKLTQVP